MEYSEKHPVIFTADGDTTSQAIGKHIEEISNIYDNLNEVCELKADLTALEEVDARKVNKADLQPAIDKTTNEKIATAKTEIDGKLAQKVNTADLPSAINTPIANAINATTAEMDGKLATKASNDALTHGLNGKANAAHSHDYQPKATVHNFGFKFSMGSTFDIYSQRWITRVHLPNDGGTWAWMLRVPIIHTHIGGGGGGDDNPSTTTYSYTYTNHSGVDVGGKLLYEFVDHQARAHNDGIVTGFCWRVD